MPSAVRFQVVLPFAISACALVISLRAQSIPPPAQQPIFRSRTDHVSLDVLVTDKNNHSITDLTAADFQITDANRPQTIADFELVTVPHTHRTVNLRSAPPPPSDVASNGLAPAASRAIAFIFDMSLSPADIVPWKREMTNFLENMSPDDQMAVAYVGRSDLGQDFTNDVGRLVHAINNLPAAMFDGQIPCGSHASRCTFIVVDNVVKTLAAAHQSRRFIVLASAWGCIPSPSNQPCRDVVELAKRADVPIYGIGPPGPFRAPPSLEVLAKETGGRAFVNSTTMTATREILADNGSYYVLGFYPDPLVADGKFHRVSVTVSRPGAHVRARQGYEAAPASDAAPTPARAMDLSLAAGLDDPTLPIRATVTPIAATVHGMKALLTVDVVYPSGTDHATIDDDLELGVLAIDPDAHLRAQLHRPLRFSAIAPASRTATLTIDDVIDLPPQQLAVRVGVSSRALRTTGTVHVPVTVTNPGNGDLQLSGVVIGVAGAKPTAVLATDLASGLVPFQPTTIRIFEAGDTLRVFARAFWGLKEPTVTATLTIDDDVGRTSGPMNLQSEGDHGNHHEAVIDKTIPLAGLRPGGHLLRVDVQLPGGKTARREIPLEIK